MMAVTNGLIIGNDPCTDVTHMLLVLKHISWVVFEIVQSFPELFMTECTVQLQCSQSCPGSFLCRVITFIFDERASASQIIKYPMEILEMFLTSHPC